MAEFAYTAHRSGSVKNETGKLEATDLNEANKHLRELGLVPIKISPVGSKSHFSFHKGIPQREKIIFTRQLAVMTKAGLPLSNALKALQRQTTNKYFQQIIGQIVTEVQGGQPLSRVLLKYPKVFPEVYVAVVKAGESSGQISEVLFNLADQQEKQAEILSKVKGALMYPAVIMIALIGVVFLIIFFVMPSLQSIFKDFGTDLPITTRILFGSSQLIRKYFYLFVPLMIAFIYLIKLWVGRPSGRKFYDRLKISVPVFGGLTKKVYMANFSRTMAMLVHASLPIIESIKIVQKTINNELYNSSFKRITSAVENGQPLSKAINKEPVFPPMVGQLVSLGEESGDLETVFTEISRFYDSEVDNLTKNMASLIEPIMLIIMGLGVGFIVASVLGPIYKLVNTIQ